MPTGTRKRKLSPAAQEDPAKPARRATRSTKASTKGKGNRAKNTEPDDEDDDSSRDLNDIAKRSKLGRTSVAEAKAEIRDKANGLLKFLETQRQLTSFQDAMSTHGVQLNEAALRANTAPPLSTALGKGAQTKAFPHPILAIDQFKGIVREYEAASKRCHNLNQPTWMRWEQDKKDLRALNQEAMSIAARIIHERIVPTAAPGTPAVLPEAASDMEKVAWDLLEEARPKKSSRTWGLAAQEILQAAAGFMRLVSDRELA